MLNFWNTMVLFGILINDFQERSWNKKNRGQYIILEIKHNFIYLEKLKIHKRNLIFNILTEIFYCSNFGKMYYKKRFTFVYIVNAYQYKSIQSISL